MREAHALDVLDEAKRITKLFFEEVVYSGIDSSEKISMCDVIGKFNKDDVKKFAEKIKNYAQEKSIIDKSEYGIFGAKEKLAEICSQTTHSILSSYMR